MVAKSNLSFAAVKQAAAGKWLEAHSHFGINRESLESQGPGGKGHACPKCGGESRFYPHKDYHETGGCMCRHCFADKNGDGIAVLAWFLGCSQGEARDRVADYLGLRESNSPGANANGKSSPASEVAPIIREVCKKKRMPIQAALEFGAQADWRGKLHVARFPAFDSAGIQCTYFDLSGSADCKGWFAKDKPRGVFLPGRNPRPGETWLLTEGVKDSAALVGLGYLACGLPASYLPKSFAALFRGVNVVLVSDLDQAGVDGAKKTTTVLKGIAKSISVARLPGEIKPSKGLDVRDFLHRGEGGGEQVVRDAIANAEVIVAPAKQAAKIILGADEHRVNREAITALANDRDLFQRAGELVHVANVDGKPVIRAVPLPLLRDRISEHARFVEIKNSNEGPEEIDKHPPEWCTRAIASLGEWPGVRQLEGIVTVPVVRPDGTLLDAKGYDQATRLLYFPGDCVPTVPANPTRADAERARDLLLDLVCDFPFSRPEHRATWIAYLLTCICRYAFTGPTPLFLIDANVRGSGKSLLADLVFMIIQGNEAQRFANPRDDDECRKRITSLAIAGTQMVLIDNIVGKLGSASLDAALTATTWADRKLGESTQIEAPLKITWAASGNNVILVADTARRVAHIRIESSNENPEERDDFKTPDILRHVRERRTELLSAAITCVRAWFAAGKPEQHLPAWGSYGGWSSIVRQCVVWLGLPDPGATRQEIKESSDRDGMALRNLIAGLEELDPDCHGVTSGQIIDAVHNGDRKLFQSLRAAVEELCPKVNARKVGNKLRNLRKRVCGGKYIDSREMRANLKGWIVRHVSPNGYCGEFSYCPTPIPGERNISNAYSATVGGGRDPNQTTDTNRHHHDSDQQADPPPDGNPTPPGAVSPQIITDPPDGQQWGEV